MKQLKGRRYLGVTIDGIGRFRLQSLLASEMRELRAWLNDNDNAFESEAIFCMCHVDDEGNRLHRLSEAPTLDIDFAVLAIIADSATHHCGVHLTAYDWKRVEETAKN